MGHLSPLSSCNVNRVHIKQSLCVINKSRQGIFLSTSPEKRQDIFKYDINTVFLIMACSKIHLFTTGVDNRPENPFFRTGRPKPCLLNSATVSVISTDFWLRPTCGAKLRPVTHRSWWL